MSLRYSKIKNNSTTFQRLFGLSPKQFNDLLSQVEPQWQKKIIGSYKRPGRDYKLDVSDMLLMTLLYYRSYITQAFVGYLFGIDDSRVCRIIRKLEPILAGVVEIPKCKKLSQKDVEDLIVDATEQPIERPKRGQKPYYSGKKKCHTLKTEIPVNLKGRIAQVSKTHPGSVHDFNLFKQEPALPQNSRAYTDSGYQGIDRLHPHAEFPYKATKKKPLNQEEKEYNKGLSRIRVIVENILGDI